jgi:hypothetical protein
MYDKQFRYRSVQDMSLCLDGKDLTKLAKCNSSLEQQWKWDTNNHLVNQQLGKKIIYHSTPTDNGLSLSNLEHTLEPGYSAVLSSVFTDVVNY